MDFHGNVNLLENEMRNMTFNAENDFPASPVVGRLVFKDFALYMCVALNGILPIWIPLTNTVNTHNHTQTVASTSWVITHNLNSSTPVVQVYDLNNNLLIPDSIVSTTASSVTVTFNTAITGRSVVMVSDSIPVDGVGILSPEQVAFTQAITAESTIVVRHNLGYYPIVRAYISGDEVQPQNVVHDSIYQTTVTFSTAQTGILRFV